MSVTLEEVRKDSAIVEALRKEFAQEQEADGAMKKLRTDLEEATKTIKSLTEQVDAFKTEKAIAEIKAKRDKLISEAKLPDVAVTDVFREQVYSAKDDDAAKIVIEDRRKLAGAVKGGGPTSKGYGGDGGGSGVTDGKTFATALKARA